MSLRTRHGPEKIIKGTAYIVHPSVVPRTRIKPKRDLDSILEEAQGLTRALGLKVVGLKVARVTEIQAGAFLGKGQREMIGEEIKDLKPEIVIVNHALSPVQQQNLEKEWKAKVIDRTGLILEIFGARAQTREGQLQVDLAALEYQRSRVVRAWTHLERQRGGGGFLGGPGEKQMELDRRRIDARIITLKRELEEVRRTRELGRKSRERVPFPIVAIVGYTNAGKSTLFNKITKANVFAEDLPFATLDPTMRRIKLSSGQPAILSDTVGFISDLPTHLVAAFRATLEQITTADVIVHVIDISRPDHEAQKDDVIKILNDLGIEYETDNRIVEVYNKVDFLEDAACDELLRQAKFNDRLVVLSALTGEGVDIFLDTVTRIVGADRVRATFELRPEDGKALSWLYDHGEVIKRKDKETAITLEVMIEPVSLAKFIDQHGYKPRMPRKRKK